MRLNLHQLRTALSFDSLIAHKVKDFFTGILSYYYPKKIIFPYESQPFQNAFISTVKKSKKKIKLIGYDHSSNPFPVYNTYNFNSPDLLYVHSDASKFFYSKYFKWPTEKVKKIPSFRITKSKTKNVNNRVVRSAKVSAQAVVFALASSWDTAFLCNFTLPF